MRRNESLRALVRETSVQVTDLIYPIFVREEATEPEPIVSMPGQFRWPLSHVAVVAKEVSDLGIPAILIFGLPAHKDEWATGAYDANGIVQHAIREAKNVAPNLIVMTDVCVCAYVPHGHCGVLNGHELPLVDLEASKQRAAQPPVVMLLRATPYSERYPAPWMQIAPRVVMTFLEVPL